MATVSLLAFKTQEINYIFSIWCTFVYGCNCEQ